MQIIFLLIILLILWIAGVIKANDFQIRSGSILEFKKILIVFPHPDDESLSVSGLCRLAAKLNIKTYLLVLTHGEAGEAYKCSRTELSTIRKNEMEKSARILKIEKLIQYDFGDGNLKSHKIILEKTIKKQITKIQPDLVITYDLSGLYGHDDHIAVSEIVTNLIKSNYKKTKLWYVSYPQKVLDMISLPSHMAKDKDFIRKRKQPNLKIFTGIGFVYSYLSVMAHRSQHKSFRKEEPWYLPLWLAYSTQVYEYFYEV